MESTLTDITLNQNEYCYLASKQHSSNSSFKVIVPKLMSMITGGSRLAFSSWYNDNDPSCQINFSHYVQTQNYITVKRSPNCSLSHKADKYGYLAKGTRLTCSCMNGNIKDLVIIDAV